MFNYFGGKIMKNEEMEKSVLVHFSHVCGRTIDTRIIVMIQYPRNVTHMQVDIHLNTHTFTSEI